MDSTRKVQVTLDARQYAAVARVARQDGRKLAAVVREAVEKYCVEPEARRRRLDAIEALYELDPAPAPASPERWEREYAELKTGLATGCVHDGGSAGNGGRDDERS